MSRTLTFQLITDTRFRGDDASHSELVNTVLSRLRELPTVTVEAGPVTRPHFGDTMQWRTRLWVQKERAVTWDRIYQTVNETQAPFYTFQ